MPKPWSRKADPDLLVVRPGSTVKRDIFKAATVGATGFTAFGALAVTGAVAGTAAHQKALEDAAKPAPPAAAPAATAPVVQKRRAHRTVVRTKVVHAASTVGVARPTTGGTVVSHSAPSTTSHSSSSSGSSTTTHSAPKPAPAPQPAPAPKPKPAPAPSSGS